MNFHDFYRIIFRYIVWCTHKKIKKPLHPPQKNEKMFETPKPKGAAGPHLIEGMLGLRSENNKHTSSMRVAPVRGV